ncbi:hypothetical protein CYMTET_19387 [Cymbomonas tetramitiformis]|uniref:Uncharacterized protein n=1 Tax=Cymbomonas tetramitiformis TaxID=36881 RepID=A0AAE0L506_9CHLO|nr:hypothetical protein CYMTET_19387 [Cymbomonas tetramitiformis]
MVEMVRELVGKGAEVDAEDGEGRTALTVALAFGQEAAARALLEAGAGVNAGTGQRPLHGAAEGGMVEMLRELVDKGADVEAEDGEGRTALTVALNGHEEVARFLVSAGAGVDVVSNDGRTPLFVAAQNGHLEAWRMLWKEAGAKEAAARALLEAGASVGKAGRSGFCALDLFLSALVYYELVILELLGQPQFGGRVELVVFGADGRAGCKRRNRRRINVYRSAPDAAETESRGAGERHAASRGADGQATTTTAADDSPPLGRPSVGCAGVTGPEQQRTTGKRRRSRASGDALGGDVDGRGADVQRMVNGGTGERHAVVGDVDELSVAEGQVKGPSVDEQWPAGGGVNELVMTGRHAVGARADEMRPAGRGMPELVMTGQHAAGARADELQPAAPLPHGGHKRRQRWQFREGQRSKKRAHAQPQGGAQAGADPGTTAVASAPPPPEDQ